jgi:hypothetical protein
MGFRRGNFMGGISASDATAALVAMGLGDRESAVAVAKYASDLDQLISDLKSASAADRAAWREQIQGDPLYTMSADQYANYVKSQQGQAVAMREGEAARLFDVAQARAASPEVAARVDAYGGLTEYGAQKFREEHPAGDGKKGLIVVGAIAVGLVAVLAVKRRRK